MNKISFNSTHYSIIWGKFQYLYEKFVTLLGMILDIFIMIFLS